MAGKRQNLVKKFMSETINYGGVAGTRSQVYSHALACCLSRYPKTPEGRSAAEYWAEQYACGIKQVAIPRKVARCLIPWNAAMKAGIVF